jgi:cobalt-zinc-cadmium efflux system membrane fusion protein
MKKINNTPMKNHLTGLLIVIILLASCSSSNEDTSAKESPNAAENTQGYELSMKQFESSGMMLGKIENRPFYEVVKANGMIDVPPSKRASVSSFFGGTVKDIQLLAGESVSKGQVLFVLENPDFVQMQQEYLEAKGQLSYLKADYERQKNLVQDNVTSQKNFLKAESDYTVTQVKMESLSKKLSLMNINPDVLTVDNLRTTVGVTSPISGFVTDVSITRGAFIHPSQAAITIVDTDHMHLELNIFENDIIKVKVGQPVKFRIQEENSIEYDATVYLVNKTVDAEKRTVGLHAHPTDKKLKNALNPGMYVQANVFTTSTSTAALPQDAIVDIEGKYFVLQLKSTSSEGYMFEKKEVQIGSSDNGFTEILNGQDFANDAQFLTKGAFNLITE